MALGRPTRDQVFLQSFGTPAPTLADAGRYSGGYNPTHVTNPNEDAARASRGVPLLYMSNPSIWKSYVAVPTNQGQRGGIAARQSMMYDPRNNPSRSQISEGYTIPLQRFTASNVWQTPSGQGTAGELQRQPSTKFVSPFSSAPIPTRMPWDL